jgi:hypothetical protein
MSAQEETVSAPPAPVENAPAADAPNSQTQATDTTQDRETNGRFKNPVQPRIDELTRKVRENEREALYWKTRAEAAAAPPKEAPKKPTPADFDDYGAYVEALTDFKADEKVNTALDAREKAAAEKQQAQTRVTTWNERVTEARKTLPDYDAVMAASDVPVADHVLDELRDSELGPQLAYHLDKNPDVAEKLNAMTQRQAAREIGRLEAKLLSTVSASPDPAADAPQKDPEPTAPKVKTTNAPPPVKPVGQGRSTAVDLSKASMDDYVKTRAAQGATWAR